MSIHSIHRDIRTLQAQLRVFIAQLDQVFERIVELVDPESPHEEMPQSPRSTSIIDLHSDSCSDTEVHTPRRYMRINFNEMP